MAEMLMPNSHTSTPVVAVFVLNIVLLLQLLLLLMMFFSFSFCKFLNCLELLMLIFLLCPRVLSSVLAFLLFSLGLLIEVLVEKDDSTEDVAGNGLDVRVGLCL